MPSVRGRALLVRARFVEERCGPGAWQRVLERLPAEARATVARVESPKWYPMEIYAALQDGVAAVCGGEKDEVLEAVGALSAEQNAEEMFGKMSGDAFEFFKHIAKLHGHLFDFGVMN